MGEGGYLCSMSSIRDSAELWVAAPLINFLDTVYQLPVNGKKMSTLDSFLMKEFTARSTIFKSNLK